MLKLRPKFQLDHRALEMEAEGGDACGSVLLHDSPTCHSPASDRSAHTRADVCVRPGAPRRRSALRSCAIRPPCRRQHRPAHPPIRPHFFTTAKPPNKSGCSRAGNAKGSLPAALVCSARRGQRTPISERRIWAQYRSNSPERQEKRRKLCQAFGGQERVTPGSQAQLEDSEAVSYTNC
jgi:hypothetical protein